MSPISASQPPFPSRTANSDAALMSFLRPEAANAPLSGILDIVNYARTKDGLVPLWVGEGSLPTPDFICEAAKKSLTDGETFYTYQRGIPELREALAAYHERLFERPFDPERFVVTGSGMQAIQMAVRMVAGTGDEVVVPSPAWPNLPAAVTVAGALVIDVPMSFDPDGWNLSMEDIKAACSERCKAIFINSPCNPTGWTASTEQLQHLLDFARERDLWIIADEIYGRFYFGQDRQLAPSFYEISEDNDKILYVNTFSKNWAMTGWRIGWISAPPALGGVLENLVQYSTSGVATFMQRGAIAALEHGEPFFAQQLERATKGRDKILSALGQFEQIRMAPPQGAFYLFFGLENEPDGAVLARQIVDQANVGLAPGFAFGQSGTAFMRLCFATNPDRLDVALERLEDWLKRKN